MQDASTPARDRVPETFPQLVLQVLQTTSVSEFNEHFRDDEKGAQREALMGSGDPQYPMVEQSLELTSNLYMTMKDDWNGSLSKSVFHASDKKDTPPCSASRLVSWNCGKIGHTFHRRK